MMSRAVWPGPAALMSGGPSVDKGEIMLPVMVAVGAFLPGAADSGPVRAERAGETLRKVQGTEVRRLPRERPHPVVERHRVQACCAAGVVVILRIRAGLRVGADDRQAVGRLRDRYLGALPQVLPAHLPLEPAPPAWAFLRGAGRCRLFAGEAGLDDPLADEDVQACQHVRSVPCHDDRSPLTCSRGR